MNTQTNGACLSLAQRATTRAVTLLAMLALLVGFGVPETEAKPKQPPVVNVVPTVNSITVQDGQLVASGMVTAEVKGRMITAPFSGVPVELSLAADQTQAGACPILDLALGPITLDLLGLVVETSPICVQITAYEGGGLLGDLLCSVANLLNGGLTLDQILGGQGLVDPTGLVTLPGLTPAQLGDLLGGLQNLLNGALENLLDAVLTLITEAAGRTCSILHLELGPLDLNLLGLEVILDDCEGGPVVVDITAVRGNLLGNLLCGLLGGGGINLGATLQDILDAILGQLGPRQPAVINVVPTINSITVQNGQLVASGIVTADIRGRTATAPFTNVPVGLSLAANQTNQTNAIGCPILNLSLGPITVDLLGLVVETSPICLKITAYEGGGLLGDLLCSVANLLNGGLTLDQILGGQGLVDPMGVVTLPGLTPAQLTGLLGGLQNLLNGALANLLDAVLTAITQATGQTCAILHLELGPLDLNLLGLEVILDDCEGGPVVVDVTAVRGNLLGNLLCGLLQPRELGLTLQDLLDAILGRLGNQM